MSGVSFSLKRRAEPAAGAAPSKAFHETSKKARTDAEEVQPEAVSELADGLVVGSSSETAPRVRVIPLQLRNVWANGSSSSVTVSAPASVSTSVSSLHSASASTRQLPPVLSSRSGSKWGLQLQGKSASTYSLDASSSPAGSNESLSGVSPAPESDGKNLDTWSLEERAIAQLIADSTALRPDVVPILQQNAVPGLDAINDPKEKYLHDVSMRPDEATPEDFELVPIEEFGIAMLRGMGYRDEDEDKNKAVFVTKSRPNLLGLGAEPPKPKLNDVRSKKHSASKLRNEIFTDGKNERVASSLQKPMKAEIKFAPGTRVKVLKEGKHFHQLGVIVTNKVKSDGIALKISMDGNREEMRCWSEDVMFI